MADNLLTVAALRTAVEAELIRGKLEAAGIVAVLFEPDKPAEGAPPARIQVQVSPPDFERAMQLLFPISKRPVAAKPAQPAWKCPKCGEEVLGRFPTCWKCGTARDGSPLPNTPPTLAGVSITAPPVTLPTMPPPPAPPIAAAASLAGEAASSIAPPRLDTSPRHVVPESSPPNLEIPTVPPVAAAETTKPSTNGESPSKSATARNVRSLQTAEEEGLKIVVPPWDAATGKPKSERAIGKKLPTDADDRAARRAFWTAVAGLLCPPLLIYSIVVVLLLGLTNRPLSARGSRFFYGALAVNAAIFAVAFAWLGTHL
jgi:hypothetical protein